MNTRVDQAKEKIRRRENANPFVHLYRWLFDAVAMTFEAMTIGTQYVPGPYPKQHEKHSAYEDVKEDKLILSDRLALDRTVLANERTALSYVRTGVMFLASGITIIKLFATRSDLAIMGYILVVLAGGTLIAGVARYWACVILSLVNCACPMQTHPFPTRIQNTRRNILTNP